MAERKTTTRKPKAATAPKRATAPRRTAKTIRNLRGTPVHMRLFSANAEKPFRIELKPRGLPGDTATIPITLIDDQTLLAAIDVLVEVITTAEAKALQGTYQPVGYLGRVDAPQIIRPEDNTVMKAKDWDGKGRRTPTDREIQRQERGSEQTAADREFGTGMHTADLPGSDQALHALLKAGQSALPPDANFNRQVTVERVRGA